MKVIQTYTLVPLHLLFLFLLYLPQKKNRISSHCPFSVCLPIGNIHVFHLASLITPSYTASHYSRYKKFGIFCAASSLPLLRYLYLTTNYTVWGSVLYSLCWFISCSTCHSFVSVLVEPFCSAQLNSTQLSSAIAPPKAQPNYILYFHHLGRFVMCTSPY